VSSSFFAATNARMLAGRVAEPLFDNEREVVVNQALAECLGGIGAAVGQLITFDSGERRVIAAVSENIPFDAAEPDAPIVFSAIGPASNYTLLVKGEAAPVDAVALRGVLERDSGLTLVSPPVALSERFERVTAARRRFFQILASVAAIGALLSTCGLFVLVSYSTYRRQREFALRMAVGSAPRQLARLVMARTGRTLGVSLGVGGVVAAAFLVVLRSLIVATGALTAIGVVLVVVVVVAVTVVASIVPALRVTRIDPAHLLKAQ
jgi:putative ABC transport system permease protein